MPPNSPETDPLEGKPAPDVALWDQDGKEFKLSEYKGQWLVLYFYPKDMTSGCTVQACDFTAKLPDFTRVKAAIVGVSPDDSATHQKFIAQEKLKIRLASGKGNEVLDAFGVWKEKNMYGKTYMGVERSTFLISPEGKVAKVWRKVKADGHADMLLQELRALRGK